MEPQTADGRHTEELLLLNDGATVGYRLGALKTASLLASEIASQEKMLKGVARLVRAGKLTKPEGAAEDAAINQELDVLRDTLLRTTGELPLPPLPRHRGGLTLLSP
ncbi:hypothetical protein [Paucibacter sp. M5-1]|uniref:hypothetical protein n=1 Tax=Paucibacter sp. M5-1 TaxID=3015998 RepID=UPI003F7CE792